MRKFLTVSAVVILVVLLLLIRAFEDDLFYDPLLEYFKGDYKIEPLPQLDFWNLLLNVFLRFLLNTGISLGILWFIFKDREIFKFSLFLYLAVFVVLISIFGFMVGASNPDTFILFYIRRFLIQPIILLLLLPAFYFQKKKIR